MSWKFVFNSNLLPYLYGSMDVLVEIVKPTGYKFFTHNGRVYTLEGVDTGITVEELV